MGRMGSSLVVLFCIVAAIAGASATDPWWPGWGDWDKKSPPPPLYPAPVTPAPPSPYYDTPPYMWPPPPVVDSSPPYALPSDPPPYVVPKPPVVPVYPTPPTASPVEPPYPWFTSSLTADSTNMWPSKWQPETTVEETFGKEAEKVYGQISLLDGVLSKGEDGYSKLLKEAIAALFNSADKAFQYTEKEVKDFLVAALSSEHAAKVQAQKFENANSAYGLFN